MLIALGSGEIGIGGRTAGPAMVSDVCCLTPRYKLFLSEVSERVMLHLVGKLIGQVNAITIVHYLVLHLRHSGGRSQLFPRLEDRKHMHPAVPVNDTMAADPATAWSLRRLARMVGVSNQLCPGCFMSVREWERNQIYGTTSWTC